ncbi:MAG TPA: acyl-CoA dehydrogenase family protein [Mycobacteriales bacterium]|nr:acyl-CoA dehydrogenase family protein [Mycobacteriales bacterium]
MDLAVTEDQQALASLTREILTDRVTPAALSALEATPGGVWDAETWKALAAAGIVGAALPEAHGGGGLGLVELGLILEEVGRAAAPLPFVATVALGALAVARHGTDAQRTALLPAVCDGSAIFTAALVEPGETDPAAPTTNVTRDSDGLKLWGTKLLVPYAGEAACVLVPAAIDDGVGVFLVDPKAPGVTVTPVVVTNREPTAMLELNGVHIADGDVLGGVTGAAGRDIVRDMVQLGTAALASLQAGLCDGALQLTASYTRERKQFGVAIGSFQAVGQREADAFIDTEVVRLTARQAQWRLSEGLPAQDEVAIAKFWAADGGGRVVHAAHHLHGGIGMDLEYPLFRYFVATRQIEHTLGSPTRQLLTLGASLAEQPA